MIREAIVKLVKGEDLSKKEIELVMEEIMTGQALPTQIAAFLTAMRIKGETLDEIAGAAGIMRRHAVKIKTRHPVVLDTCGTGGDERNTFNVSTVAAFVAAGAGVVVAKHGNRGVSSKCGSADLLKALGVNIEAEEHIVSKCIDEVGIGFLFAPALHKAMQYAIGPRREIGIRTIFNILGPMTNPAGATNQLLGVYDAGLTRLMAEALGRLGSKHALVVHGKDGLDEVTTADKTQISELKGGKVKTFDISPRDFGIKKARPEEFRGGDPAENAKITMDILSEEKGPAYDIVILNAGCAIYAADKALNIKEGIKLAEESIESGAALGKLQELKEATNA
ncbi:MAG: anthranilate phosphoribosyltransferase [Omnitrophica WOR_2 bacterium RIFCSPHIGHO2_01_FULL_49_10]|nr:MAG: anthranilate phosphoribosyltransferase [Omnitrophica WOR_2 bacterium RIFCSPHIGHO2_01_FULL_49_10]